MQLSQVCQIAAEAASVRIVISYSGESKFALGISDGVTTPIIATGTPEEIETSIAGQLPDYLAKVATEAAERKAKEEEHKRIAAERAALAEQNRKNAADRAAAKKTAEANKENQLELSFE